MDHEPILGAPPEHQPFYRNTPLLHGNRNPSPTPKEYFILVLHLSGYKAGEIAELAGLAGPQSVYSILRKKELIALRQQLLEGLELEFEALQREVFRVIEESLNDLDPKVRLEAVDKWFKYFGKYKTSGSKQSQEITAEDVVKSILQVNVQVGVENVIERSEGSTEPILHSE